MFSLLRKWLGRFNPFRPTEPPKECRGWHFLMVTRGDCPLCAEAWDLLLAHQKQRGFILEKIDVDAHPDLVAKYGDCVPVVMVNGQMRFRGRINEVLLRRLFV